MLPEAHYVQRSGTGPRELHLIPTTRLLVGEDRV